MSRGWQEVDTAVDAGVGDPSLPVDVQLLLQIFLVLLVDVRDDGLPAEEKQHVKVITCERYLLAWI